MIFRSKAPDDSWVAVHDHESLAYFGVPVLCAPSRGSLGSMRVTTYVPKWALEVVDTMQRDSVHTINGYSAVWCVVRHVLLEEADGANPASVAKAILTDYMLSGTVALAGLRSR